MTSSTTYAGAWALEEVRDTFARGRRHTTAADYCQCNPKSLVGEQHDDGMVGAAGFNDPPLVERPVR